MFLYFPRLASGCNTYPTLKLDPDRVRLNHCAEHLVRSHFIAHRQTTRAQQTDCSTRTTKMIGNYTLITVSSFCYTCPRKFDDDNYVIACVHIFVFHGSDLSGVFRTLCVWAPP